MTHKWILLVVWEECGFPALLLLLSISFTFLIQRQGILNSRFRNRVVHDCCIELEAITEFMKQLSSRDSRWATPDTTKASQGYTESVPFKNWTKINKIKNLKINVRAKIVKNKRWNIEKLKTDIRLIMKKTENINYQHKEVLQRIILNVYYIFIYFV